MCACVCTAFVYLAFPYLALSPSLFHLLRYFARLSSLLYYLYISPCKRVSSALEFLPFIIFLHHAYHLFSTLRYFLNYFFLINCLVAQGRLQHYGQLAGLKCLYQFFQKHKTHDFSSSQSNQIQFDAMRMRYTRRRQKTQQQNSRVTVAGLVE